MNSFPFKVKYFRTLFLLILPSFIKAQSVLPAFFKKTTYDLVPSFSLSKLNENTLLREDSLSKAMGDKTLRFGYPVLVNIDLWKNGKKIYLDDGRIACLFKIKSENAKNINLIFSHFEVPSGSLLFIYNKRHDSIQGGFSKKDQTPGKTFSTLPIPGDELIVEYNGPANLEANLKISHVIHGYRDFQRTLRDFGDSGPCNVNINCPPDNVWSNQAASVVMMMTANNSRFCSGALINNTAADGTPFILTAEHCEPSETDIFIFNYQSDGCNNIESRLDQFIQGCTIRASNKNSDFTLVELNSIPENFQAYLSGWNHSDSLFRKNTVIHHPEGDIKKISRDDDTLSLDSYLGSVCWRISDYESGTTEPGSSGAPLFDKDKRIIGQLNGGEAECNNNVNDFYGKFSVSWNGENASERLRDWLDPKSLGIKKIEGQPYSFIRQSFDARLAGTRKMPDIICGDSLIYPEAEIKNMGTLAIDSLLISIKLNDDPIQQINWSGKILPSGSAFIPLNKIQASENLNQRLRIWVMVKGPFPDTNPLNDTIVKLFDVRKGYPVLLDVKTDDKPFEFSLQIENDNNQVVYEILPGSIGDNHQKTTNLCLPKGCYTLRAYDSGGNGICCDSGNGFYALKSENGLTLINGGVFKSEDAHIFCFDSSSSFTKIRNPFRIKVFPVPADDFLMVELPEKNFHKSMEVYSISGQRISVISNHEEEKLQISTYGLSDGLYMIKVTDEIQEYYSLFSVQH